MIEYINKRMNDWAAWCKRRDDGGLGYPGKSNYCSLVQTHGDRAAGPITESAPAMEIEGIIIAMRAKAPAQYAVAEWFYLKGSHTVKRIAQELGCGETTAYTRLHALHLAVMNALHDIEIEAQDRAYENRVAADTKAKLRA
jgi:hypothetical protein